MRFKWKLFIENRINRTDFSGLPLTIFTIIFLILLFTFIGVTSLVVTSSPIIALDFSFSRFLYQHRIPELQHLCYYITQFADRGTILILLTIFLLYVLMKKELAYLYSTAITVLGNEITVSLIKNFINRNRPALDAAYFIEKTKSFPSGHSAIAMAFFGLIIYYLIRHVAQKNKRNIILLFGALLIIFIGFSRLYLGVHYLTDVLGGFLLGGLWLAAGITFREHHFYTASIKKGKDNS